MKIVLFLIFVAVVSASASAWKLKTRAEYAEIEDNCVKDFTASNYIEKKRPKEDEKYPPREIFQIIQCYFRGIGIWSDLDGFLVDRIMIGIESAKADIENYNERLLREGFEKCSDKNTEASSPLDWGYRCFKCFMDNKYLLDSLKETEFHQH